MFNRVWRSCRCPAKAARTSPLLQPQSTHIAAAQAPCLPGRWAAADPSTRRRTQHAARCWQQRVPARQIWRHLANARCTASVVPAAAPSAQAYVDQNLMCPVDPVLRTLSSAALLGHDGSVWAQSPTFPAVTSAEAAAIMQILADPTSHSGSFTMGGVKYMVIASDDPGQSVGWNVHTHATGAAVSQGWVNSWRGSLHHGGCQVHGHCF